MTMRARRSEFHPATVAPGGIYGSAQATPNPAVPLESVISTGELATRPSRQPDHEAVTAALIDRWPRPWPTRRSASFKNLSTRR